MHVHKLHITYEENSFTFNLMVNLLICGLYNDLSYHIVTLRILGQDFTRALDNIALVANNNRKQDLESPTLVNQSWSTC